MPKFRTPLRYPGGKQRLTPFVAEILETNDATGCCYAEPYAGGAGVAMELLLDGRVRHVYLNDSSVHLYAFWHSMLSDPEAFCRKISRASLSLESWKRHRAVVRSPEDHDRTELGFSTFYLNRCNRSGILTAGVIGGLQQLGKYRIDARFPRTELIKRVEAIATRKARISVSNLDAEKFMVDRVNALPKDTLVYCDPPYFERAERLYLNAYQPSDHARVSKTIQRRLKRPWIISYDSHAAIANLYSDRRMFRYSLQYSAIEAYAGTELFVFSDDLEIPKTSSLPYVADGLKRLSA